MKVSNKKGFTIVELMVSMITLSILLLTVGSMLVFGWRGWRRMTDTVNMQRDAVIALNWISKEIRNSKGSEISWDASGIYFAADGFRRTNDVDISTSDIAYFDGVHIQNFNVSTNNEGVRVQFVLFTDGNTDANNYDMTVLPRN